MKKHLSIPLLFLFLLCKSGYSQKPNELVTPTDEGFHFLYSNCKEDAASNNCFKFVLDCKSWENSYNYWRVPSSNIIFFYYPEINNDCSSPKIFILKPSNLTWRYFDKNTTIIIKMIPVETAFSYQLSEINIITNKGANCLVPPSMRTKDPYKRNY